MSGARRKVATIAAQIFIAELQYPIAVNNSFKNHPFFMAVSDVINRYIQRSIIYSEKPASVVCCVKLRQCASPT